MSVRWNRNEHEEALLKLFSTGTIGPIDSAGVVFKKFAHLWQGIKESNFAKHFKRVKTSFINTTMNPAVAKSYSDPNNGKFSIYTMILLQLQFHID